MSEQPVEPVEAAGPTESAPLDPVGDYASRPYSEAVTDEHRAFLAAVEAGETLP